MTLFEKKKNFFAVRHYPVLIITPLINSIFNVRLLPFKIFYLKIYFKKIALSLKTLFYDTEKNSKGGALSHANQASLMGGV